MAVEPQIFKAGMRRLASGVSLVTTIGEDEVRRGLTATAVCSVSLVPPTLLCCVNRASSAHDTIRDSGILAINVLAASEYTLADRFGGTESPESRFDHGRWTTLVTGAPILETALASFDCRVTEAFDSGSHSVFLAEVVATRIEGSGEPLVYLAGDYGSFSALISPR
jgi:flavin reductase